MKGLILCYVFAGFLIFGQSIEVKNGVTNIIRVLELVRQSSWQYSPSNVCYPEIGCFFKGAGLLKHIGTLPEAPSKIGTKFRLYREGHVNAPKDVDYLKMDNLDDIPQDKPLKIISHGYASSSRENWIGQLTNLFIEKENATVIVMDWENGARSPLYATAVINSELVGRQAARLVQRIIEQRGFSPKLVHFIGFSLGGQVAGFFGEYLKNRLGISVGRITGLDPAFLLFETYFHLNQNHADFVDIIHTSAGGNLLMGDMGMWTAAGHVDFYPNGGKSQPGCPPRLFSNCKHFRAHEFFVESVRSTCPFTAYPCPAGWSEFQKGNCNTNDSAKLGRLGYYSELAPGRGILYLKTTAAAPFCIS